jgi:hypothetical protein
MTSIISSMLPIFSERKYYNKNITPLLKQKKRLNYILRNKKSDPNADILVKKLANRIKEINIEIKGHKNYIKLSLIGNICGYTIPSAAIRAISPGIIKILQQHSLKRTKEETSVKNKLIDFSKTYIVPSCSVTTVAIASIYFTSNVMPSLIAAVW